MARSCGLRIGPRRFEFVVLEGSAKKHRITAFMASEFPQGEEEPIAAAAAVLKEAAKTHGIPSENIGVAIDTGLAAFRTLKLPFSDREKIEEVLKFEVENQLPQWNVDDVVVDWLAMEKSDTEAHLLVMAVPKVDLGKVLQICARAGLEPLEVDLEATAIVNASLAADICHVDDAQVLVHIGEYSTSVVVMDGGQVRSMRAIHMGALSHDSVAEPVEEGAAPPEGEAPPPIDEALAPEELQRRLEHAVSRIRRELGRTVSGARTAHPITAVYVAGIELPELVGTSVLDVPIYELDVFEEDSGQPAQGTAPLVVAYGMALRQLGAPNLGTSLRREELRYTGAFERIELPVAVAALLLVTWLAVFNIFEAVRMKARDRDVDLWRRSSNNFMLGRPAEGTAGSLEQPPESITKYIEDIRKLNKQEGVPADKNPELDPDRTRLEQMERVRQLLRVEIAELNKNLGNTGEITQPQSALEAMSLAVGTLEELGEQIGRASIRRIDSQYQAGRSGNTDTVRVQLNLSFWGETALQATEHMELFSKRLREKPWVVEVNDRGSNEMKEDTGIFVDNYTVICDLAKVQRKQADT
jgi:type IV pilus assembly PilM-like protein